MQLHPSEISELIGPGSRRPEHIHTFGEPVQSTLIGNRGIQRGGTRSLGADEGVAFLTARIQGANVFQTVAAIYGKR